MKLSTACLGLLVMLPVVGCGQRTADEKALQGDELAKQALGFSEQVEAVLQRKAELVEELAAEPKIVEAVKASNQAHKDTAMSEILRLDKDWQATEGMGELMKALVTNECAQCLVEFQDNNDGFPEVFVTDQQGLIVGETNKTSDYYQADEAWWVEAYNDGSGKTYHGEIEFDTSARSESISVYVPVRDPEVGNTIGVIKAVCDITVIKMEL